MMGRPGHLLVLFFIVTQTLAIPANIRAHVGTFESNVSFIQTGIRASLRISEEDQEAEEIMTAVERRFKDISASMSLAACAKRAPHDLALSFGTAIEEQMTTQFVMIIVKALGTVILTIFVIIVVIVFMEELGGPLSDAAGEACLKAVEPFVIVEISPIVEERLGTELLADLENNLLNKVAMLVVGALVFHVPRAMGKELPPRLLNYVVRVEAPQLAKTVAHNVIHAVTQRVIHNLSHDLVETAAFEVTETLSHQLVNYYYCVYCYQSGKFCRNCQTYNQFKAADSQVR